MKDDALSFGQSIWIAASVVCWVLISSAFLLNLPSNSVISPAFWLHLSATLIMLLLVSRISGNIVGALYLYAIKISWVLLAVLIGIIYWYLDHWLMSTIFNTNSEASIENWNQSNAKYHVLSVFFSAVILAPLFEELFFRGLIFNCILQRFNFVSAITISSLLFTLIHWSWPEFISLFFAGVIYALMTHKSNSVMTAVIAHIVHNLMTYFYYIH